MDPKLFVLWNNLEIWIFFHTFVNVDIQGGVKGWKNVKLQPNLRCAQLDINDTRHTFATLPHIPCKII